MIGKGPIFAVAGVAALAAIVFASSSSKKKTSAAALEVKGLRVPEPPPRPPAPGLLAAPAPLVQQVSQALDTLDPGKIRATAAAVERKGFPDHAADLRIAADEIEHSVKGAA